MKQLVFDTGALIAVQRDLTRYRSLIRLAREHGVPLRTSAAVLTEFLGGSPRRSRAAASFVASRLVAGNVTGDRARRAALLQQGALDAGRSTDPDAIDALVAAEAEQHGGLLVIDGDRPAFEALAEASHDGITLADLDDLIPRSA